jgi:Fimbrial assembly protein (PilN)
MQQVNLYSEILNQQQNQTGIQLLIATLGGLAFLCISFSVYLVWDVSSTETELHQAQQSLTQQKAQVSALLSKRASQTPNALLLTEIDQWQNSVNEASQTLQMLAGSETILSQGFSYYLQALAIQSNPDVWLTAIHINGQKEEVQLEGSTFKPQQIPQTLQQLQNKSALKGLTFAKLVMQQSPKVAGQMDFTLSTAGQSSDEKAHVQ